MKSTSKKYQAIKENSLFPIIVIAFLSLIWGSSFILIKKGLIVYNPIQVGTLRIFFAGLVLLPIALKNLEIFKKHWKKLLALGLISNFTPAILFAVAETKLSSSLAGMLNALTPIFTILIGILFYKTKVTLPLSLGLVLGFVGSLIISFVGSEGGLGSFNHFTIYVIIATILYGISANLVKQYVNEIHPVVLISLSMFAVAPISIIFLLSTDFISITSTNPDWYKSLVAIFVLGAIGTAFALTIFNRLIKHTSAIFAASVTYLIPIVAIFWGLADGEVIYPLHYAGITVIIISIFIINRFK